jgi:hypothetical protein
MLSPASPVADDLVRRIAQQEVRLIIAKLLGSAAANYGFFFSLSRDNLTFSDPFDLDSADLGITEDRHSAGSLDTTIEAHDAKDTTDLHDETLQQPQEMDEIDRKIADAKRRIAEEQEKSKLTVRLQEHHDRLRNLASGSEMWASDAHGKPSASYSMDTLALERRFLETAQKELQTLRLQPADMDHTNWTRSTVSSFLESAGATSAPGPGTYFPMDVSQDIRQPLLHAATLRSSPLPINDYAPRPPVDESSWYQSDAFARSRDPVQAVLGPQPPLIQRREAMPSQQAASLSVLPGVAAARSASDSAPARPRAQRTDAAEALRLKRLNYFQRELAQSTAPASASAQVTDGPHIAQFSTSTERLDAPRDVPAPALASWEPEAALSASTPFPAAAARTVHPIDPAAVEGNEYPGSLLRRAGPFVNAVRTQESLRDYRPLATAQLGDITQMGYSQQQPFFGSTRQSHDTLRHFTAVQPSFSNSQTLFNSAQTPLHLTHQSWDTNQTVSQYEYDPPQQFEPTHLFNAVEASLDARQNPTGKLQLDETQLDPLRQSFRPAETAFADTLHDLNSTQRTSNEIWVDSRYACALV